MGGSRCLWQRAGAGCEQSAAAREARGRRVGAGARARAGASVGGEHSRAAKAGAAAAMAVAVGRPSVSAGASLPSPAAPPALGGSPLSGGCRGRVWGTRAGAPDCDGCGCGCGCVHEFGRASGTEGKARNPQGRLLRDATVYRRLVAPRFQGCGRKRTPLLFSL